MWPFHRARPALVHSIRSQLRGVSCAICSKFTKKLLECALPVTPSGGTTDDALFDAMEACLTTPWDGVLAQ